MQYTSINRRKESLPVKRGMSKMSYSLKRFFDIVLSAIGIILLAPVYLFIIIALWIQRNGSVIYKQERIGLNGKSFNILKFRTMTENAEQNGPQLEIANDPRLTKVGKVLRKHHLDELPQLFNVLIGEMSLVGYRPERKFFIDQIMEKDARYECLYQMRPGLTSEATLYNGYTNSVEKMLERLNMDLRYLEMGSIRTDIKIILSTIKLIVLGGKTL
jgi:lipopolysaccharide/colanic/teichoic acid biosynthesis glycosyltransferase